MSQKALVALLARIFTILHVLYTKVPSARRGGVFLDKWSSSPNRRGEVKRGGGSLLNGRAPTTTERGPLVASKGIVVMESLDQPEKGGGSTVGKYEYTTEWFEKIRQ